MLVLTSSRKLSSTPTQLKCDGKASFTHNVNDTDIVNGTFDLYDVSGHITCNFMCTKTLTLMARINVYFFTYSRQFGRVLRLMQSKSRFTLEGHPEYDTE